MIEVKTVFFTAIIALGMSQHRLTSTSSDHKWMKQLAVLRD